MSKIEGFLSQTEQEEIVNAIRIAERQTSGEIRVHIEKTSKIEVFDRAKEVFHFLKMDMTKLQNGVLIYLAISDRRFVIIGDKGINEVVPKDFWDTTCDVMRKHFKQDNFKQGLIEGVLKAGKQLEKHFPWDTMDKNELPNTLSKG